MSLSTTQRFAGCLGLIRGRFPVFILLILLLVTGQAGAAGDPKVTFPGVPDWVQEVAWTPTTEALPVSKKEGTRCLLYESQDRPKKAEEFTRIIELMENDQGVQDSGSLRIGFNAEFQDLCIHRVVIHRGGKTIDRLNPDQVRVIQQEPELGSDMLTGHKTALLLVEDLRVGDILEYAYTVRGANPALDGHYSDRFIIQSGTPADRELFRVVWEDAKPLQQRAYASTSPAVVEPWDGGTAYAWSYTNLSAIEGEDYQPDSFESCPYVEVSDFEDWGSVVDWALPLYDVMPTNVPPPEVTELLARWEQAGRTDEDRARLALEFVQDELRYTGIELGPDSYRPANPLETLHKRFGDCKGKVVLLQYLLQQMAIKSYPALVSASDHEGVGARLPSPFVFNHVILQVHLGNNVAWVDPTASHQGGSLWDRQRGQYGKALVLRPGRDELEDVPSPPFVWRQDAVSSFVMADYKGPVNFTVHTEYRGASADDMRDRIAGTDPADLLKNYLNYYTRLYPGVTGAQPLKINDDRVVNLLTVDEEYAITNFWTLDEEGKLLKANFYADNLYNALTDPQTRLRKTPLALDYPLLRKQKVVIHLPDPDWTIPDAKTNVETDAFVFSKSHTLAGSTLTYDFECRTKTAAIPPESVTAYLVKRDHLDDMLTMVLQQSAGGNGAPVKGTNWFMVVVAILGGGATAAGMMWYWRRVKRMPPALPSSASETIEPWLKGLGGWLILVGIGLCAAPILRVVYVGQHLDGYFSAKVWHTVAMPQGVKYHPLFGPLLVVEMLGHIFLLGMNVLVLCLFFSKRRQFPWVYITFLVLCALFLMGDFVGAEFIPSLRAGNHSETLMATGRAIGSTLIWSLYMVKSRRVKATFIR